MKKNLSIGLALKLSLLILTSIGLIFAAVFAYNYVVSRRIVIRNLALATVNRIDTIPGGVEKVPQNMAALLENLDRHDRTLEKMLRAVVRENWEISGATIAFEPYGRGPQKKNAPCMPTRRAGAFTSPVAAMTTSTANGTRFRGSWDAPSGPNPTTVRRISIHLWRPAQCLSIGGNMACASWPVSWRPKSSGQ